MALASTSLNLPTVSGEVEAFSARPATDYGTGFVEPRTRVAFAAAHVVPDPLVDINPTFDVALDWEATLAYRRYLWSMGLRVAEAMDTAQRGMGLDWETTRELIRRSVAEGKAVGGQLASGAGTDQLRLGPELALDDVIAAYEEQFAYVEGLGGRIIMMASRALAACARSSDDYALVYGRILEQASEPVIIHWLGAMFDPALAGYWGNDNLDQAMDTAVAIITQHADKVDGVKVSLLDDQREVDMRRRLPKSVRMYTGDDFNYPDLIKGDEQGYSNALLGILDPIAPVAGAAFAALDTGDMDRYDELFAPTVPLSRHIFKAPTQFYKTGVVFLAWLNGHQDHFRMVNAQESCRSVVHLAELFRLADAAHLFRDPERSTRRMRSFLEVAGVAQ